MEGQCRERSNGKPWFPVASALTAANVSYFRHSLVVRVTHWVNFLCVTLLFMSGLQIFNAHPALYLGRQSNFDRPIFWLHAASDDSSRGVELVDSFAGIGGGKGGYWEDRGYEWFAGI